MTVGHNTTITLFLYPHDTYEYTHGSVIIIRDTYGISKKIKNFMKSVFCRKLFK